MPVESQNARPKEIASNHGNKPEQSSGASVENSKAQAQIDPNVPPEFQGELVEGAFTLGPMRKWSSTDEKFHTNARYVSAGGPLSNLKVKLKKEDGTEIQVEEIRLSEDDRKWLAAYLDWKHHGRKTKPKE